MTTQKWVSLNILAFISLVSHVQAQTFAGTISPSGYVPPDNVWVQWCQMGEKPTCKSFQLDKSIPWDGQSAEGKFGRYAGGDKSVQGFSTLPAVSGEAKGGEIGAALLFLLGRPYSERELWDFAFSNPCGDFICGCSWYERVTGSSHPIDPGCKNERSSSGGVKTCPNDPPGCGSRALPCISSDPSLPLDRAVSRPCQLGGRRVGRWMIRNTNPPIPTPTPVPTPTPIPTPTPTPLSSVTCYILKIAISGESIVTSLNQTACPK